MHRCTTPTPPIHSEKKQSANSKAASVLLTVAPVAVGLAVVRGAGALQPATGAVVDRRRRRRGCSGVVAAGRLDRNRRRLVADRRWLRLGHSRRPVASRLWLWLWLDSSRRPVAGRLWLVRLAVLSGAGNGVH